MTGNLDNAKKTCDLWAQTYPRAFEPHSFLAGIVYTVNGNYEKAVVESRKAIELDPEWAIGYDTLAKSQVCLGHLGEAAQTLRRAAESKVENTVLPLRRYEIAFLQGDRAGMESAAVLSREKYGTDSAISDLEPFILAYSGHLQQAERLSRRWTDMARQPAQREQAALFQAGAALWEGLFGNAPEVKQRAMAALELSTNREVEYGAGLALALSGDSPRPQTLANDLEKRFGEDTCVRYSYLPVIRALLALNHGQPSTAIQLLQIAAPYEMGTPRSSIHGFFGALYPVYVRGLAYLAARQGVEAAAEFRKILDHRGIVSGETIGALAGLQLGRALALSGDKAKAKRAYQDFLTLWKDADPDIPILKQAKSEYARLL